MGAKAQVGYQIALLNTATGEVRANETVKVSVSLSNSANEIFYSETKQATTNDFGVLSLTIGNADTFKDVDLNKMPFFIEVTANDVLIGKSQMLSVPVAEVAKRVAPLDKGLIVGKWEEIPKDKTNSYCDYTFMNDNTVSWVYHYHYTYGDGSEGWKEYEATYNYVIEGKDVIIYGLVNGIPDSNDLYNCNELKFIDGLLFDERHAFKKIQ